MGQLDCQDWHNEVVVSLVWLTLDSSRSEVNNKNITITLYCVNQNFKYYVHTRIDKCNGEKPVSAEQYSTTYLANCIQSFKALFWIPAHVI